jgi:hypothetical protein
MPAGGRLDTFRQSFNEERPHEALGQATPTSRYAVSNRPFPARVEDPWYDAHHEVRRVRSDGTIKWRNELIFVSEALIGELLGLISPSCRFHRFTAARLGRREALRNRNSLNHVPGSQCQP